MQMAAQAWLVLSLTHRLGDRRAGARAGLGAGAATCALVALAGALALRRGVPCSTKTGVQTEASAPPVNL